MEMSQYKSPEPEQLSQWDNYYLNLLDGIRSKSKDPSTRVGAIIVDSMNKIVSTGFNGFAMGVLDNLVLQQHRYERPLKYDFTIHAELNSILLQARTGGTSLVGCRMYCSLHPCAACANAIVQTGITHVLAYNPPKEMQERLANDFKFETARIIFMEGGVHFRAIDKE
jgi:dCMP deaminase